MRLFAAAVGRVSTPPLRTILFALLVLPLLVSSASARRQDTAALPPPMVEGRATWDDRFLYFAFVVDDSDILGTNTKPMSHSEQDDSIGVYLSTGKEKPGAPDATTYAMIVSAAGGFSFLTGDPQKKAFVEHPLFTIKYGVAVRGTLNRSDDRDKSFTVTIAIPFDAIGVDPKTLKPGAEFGFDVVARQRGGGMISLAEDVKAEADVAAPAKWKRLVLLGPEAADPAKVDAAKYPGAVVAASVAAKAKPPLIDGAFRPEDWPPTSRITFRSPDVARTSPAVVPAPLPGDEADATAPVLRTDIPLTSIGKRVLARYLLAYQADTHKAANPSRGIFGPDGTLLLRDQPATGIGPWFSTDRVSWHRSQLTDMRRAGVDVALVETAGPEGDTGLLDEKSLIVLLSALRGMTADGVPAPDIAPCLDTAMLVPSRGPKLDLATEAGRDTLYEAIRHWFAHVPPEYRLRVSLPSATANGRAVSAYPVFLSDGNAVANASDGAWVDDMRRRFAADFGAKTAGTTLLFVGGSGFDSAPGIAAAVPMTKAGIGKGALPIAVVQPGIDSADALTPRRDGAVYQAGWEAAYEAKAGWVLIDSWNDWTRGTEVAASRQYGFRYVESTRILSIASHGLTPRAVEWMDNDVPRRVRPGQVVTANVAVRNVGSTVLRGTDGISIAYRWRQGDKIVAQAPLRLPLSTPLLPTQTVRLPVGIVTARPVDNGKLEPLPPGDYTLEIDFTAAAPGGSPVFFSDPEGGAVGAPLRVNVTVAADTPDSVEFGGTTTPTMLVGGATYPVRVRLRWMGSEPLTPDAASLVYQILTEDGKTTVTTGTAPLIQALQPGQWETVPVAFRAGDASGPLPPACPEVRRTPTDALGGYRIRWLLTRKESVAAVPGEYVEQAAVYPSSAMAQVVPTSSAAQTVEAGALITINVQVTNRGPAPWPKGTFRVGCHWFFSDGLEADWKPQLTTQITRDVAPSETVTVPVIVRTPDREGVFIAAFDVTPAPETYLSSGPVSPPNDLGLLPMYVRGGRLRFIDLSKLFSITATAWETKPGSGNFDGEGTAFPAESFPPDNVGIAAFFADRPDLKKNPPPYPSGYYAEGQSAARQVSFRFGGGTTAEARDAVTCQAQVISVPPGHYTGLHVAVAATGGQDRLLEMMLRYKDGSPVRVAPTAADWLRPPGVAEAVAIRTNRKRTKDADLAATCTVRHVILPLEVTKELIAITLPKDEKIKIFAITLEK
jgi:hypothetical protein